MARRGHKRRTAKALRGITFPGKWKVCDNQTVVAGKDADAPWAQKHCSSMFSGNVKTGVSWNLQPRVTCPSVFACKEGVGVSEICAGCYASRKGKPITWDSSTRAMRRRLQWFQKAPEDMVVATLSQAIRDLGTSKPLQRVGMEKHFRVFASGDFHNPRAVRIWHRVVNNNRQVQFWFPTATHWSKHYDTKFGEPLRALNTERNATVRPSSWCYNMPPTVVEGLSKGSSVLAPNMPDGRVEISCAGKGGKGEKRIVTMRNLAKELDVRICPAVKGPTQKTSGCGDQEISCRMCWHDRGRGPAYPFHGIRKKRKRRKK